MHNFGTFSLCALAACTLLTGSLATSLRGGYIFQLDDISPNQSDSICLPKLPSLLNDVVQAQNRGNTNTRESDKEIKSKLETLEVNAKLEGQLQGLQEGQTKLEDSLLAVKTQLEGQLQGVENKLKGHLQEVQTKLQAQLNENLQIFLNEIQFMLIRICAAKEKVPVYVNKTVPFGFELIGNRYFRIINEFAKWETAEKRCREMGGDLAAFQNEEEINAITPKLEKYRSYWLGINDRDNEGHFESVASRMPAPFLKWAEEEPNDLKHEENCVSLYVRDMWDGNCNNEYYFICEAEQTTILSY